MANGYISLVDIRLNWQNWYSKGSEKQTINMNHLIIPNMRKQEHEWMGNIRINQTQGKWMNEQLDQLESMNNLNHWPNAKHCIWGPKSSDDKIVQGSLEWTRKFSMFKLMEESWCLPIRCNVKICDGLLTTSGLIWGALIFIPPLTERIGLRAHGIELDGALLGRVEGAGAVPCLYPQVGGVDHLAGLRLTLLQSLSCYTPKKSWVSVEEDSAIHLTLCVPWTNVWRKYGLL